MVHAIQVLMPMAGRGQRFKNAGVNTPKPLILVDGRAMFTYALDPLRGLIDPWELICVVLAEHESEYSIGDVVRTVVPGARTVAISQVTQGAADTCLAAAGQLRPEAPLLVLDCDISFSSAAFGREVHSAITTNGADVILLSFESSDPRFSYADVDNSGRVARTAEKQVISSHALGGAYFFTRASDFLAAATELKETPLSSRMPEYYVSLVVDLLIRNGKSAIIAEGAFTSLGTPEELAKFLNAR